jgi:hypothetical protein
MKKILLLICAAALICATEFQVQANTIITDAGAGAVFSSANSNEGYDFTVGSTALSVTALGLWDGPSPNAIGDGFVDQHQVGLWTNNGFNPGTLLASITIPAGTAASLIGGFRYVDLQTPVILLPGTSYVVGAFFLNATDPVTNDVGGNHAGYDPAVTEGDARARTSLSFGYPGSDDGPGALVGPNALFTLVPNGNGVPESGATAGLMAIAVGGLLAARRMVRA